jgi:hypothetical protein
MPSSVRGTSSLNVSRAFRLLPRALSSESPVSLTLTCSWRSGQPPLPEDRAFVRGERASQEAGKGRGSEEPEPISVELIGFEPTTPCLQSRPHATRSQAVSRSAVGQTGFSAPPCTLLFAPCCPLRGARRRHGISPYLADEWSTNRRSRSAPRHTCSHHYRLHRRAPSARCPAPHAHLGRGLPLAF